VGEEQSGHVKEVGFELYQSMLEEAISRIRSGEAEGLPGDGGQWSPQINLGVPVLIPEDYVPDLDVRLGLYRRLSQLDTKVELEGFAAELIDRFGTLPKGGQHAFAGRPHQGDVQARPYRAARCRAKGRDGAVPHGQVSQSRGAGRLCAGPERAGQGADNKIVVRRDWASEADKIKGAFAIARDLACMRAARRPERSWPFIAGSIPGPIPRRAASSALPAHRPRTAGSRPESGAGACRRKTAR
jgi:transcription-repair coupling factor (superfamily II helicase)